MSSVAPTESDLVTAVRAGNDEDVARLLACGADPDETDSRGVPLLRIAATANQPRVAALLLAHGADPETAAPDGAAALSADAIETETLHRIRQHYHRLDRDPGQARPDVPPALRASAEQLRNDGIVRLEGLLDDATLTRMRADFDSFVRRLNTRILRGAGMFRHYDEEEHYWPRDRAYVSNNAFRHSAALARFCGRSDLLGLIGAYLGGPPRITRAVAMRYLPDREKDHDMYGWHHDMEDRRLKVLVLLTDVGPADQYMSYVRGSNRLLHPYPMFLDNACPLSYCERHLERVEIFRTIGRAGDVFVFDSNGAHRGNRRPQGAVRDAWFVEYSTDLSDVWGTDLEEESLDGLDAMGRQAFEAILGAPKKWERNSRRASPTWAENLPDVARWVRRSSRHPVSGPPGS